MGITALNGLLLKQMIIAGANELNNNKQLVDSLNVFPVPDGDTGTNMSLTAIAAAKECEKSNSLMLGEIAALAASGALRGARGNSGVITSQLFRGFAKELEGLNEAGTKELALAIRRGVKTAYKAVMKPKEGTILSVARACAEKGEKAAAETDDIELFLKEVIEGAQAMLIETPEMLPVLKQAGVVDAGGKGLLCILEGAYKQMTGQTITLITPITQSEYVALASVDNESITFGYCTEFFISAKNVSEAQLQNFKGYLSSIGDSIVCVSDEEIIKIHVHTDHPGLVLEKAIPLGSLSGLKIDNMRQQHTNKINFQNTPQPINTVATDTKTKKESGFVSIASGNGFKDIFVNLGVDYVIEGGQSMNPSTEEILNAIDNINAENIYVLPNNKNIILAAEQAAKLSQNKNVTVIPSKTLPEGITALFHYTQGSDSNANDMIQSMKGVKSASLTFAVRDTQILDRQIKQGDILGMVGSSIEVTGTEISDTAEQLINRIINEDTEIVSIYYGEDITEKDAQQFLDKVQAQHPDIEIELQWGGQPLYYYIFSAE